MPEIHPPVLSGPIVTPENGHKPDQIVLLLHGVGADGQDLIGLVPYFQKILPRAIFISPNAPHPFDMAAFGYQWFSLREPTKENRLAGAQEASPILENYIDSLLADNGMTESQLAIVGFSQGAMMALHTGLRRSRPVAGILGYSGALVGEDILETELTSRPRVRLIHGDADAVVPPEMLDHAVEHLKANRVPVDGHLISGVGHTMDEEGIKLGMEFLAECFGVDLDAIRAELLEKKARAAAQAAAAAEIQAANDDGPAGESNDETEQDYSGETEDMTPAPAPKSLEDHDISGLIPGIHVDGDDPEGRG